VIRVDEDAPTMAGGIHLGGTVANQPVGTVEAVYRTCTDFKVGDRVFFNKHSGTGYKENELDSKSPEFKIVSEDDILGWLQQ
jgi:co-chaperonin GroES (HSP10)